MEGGGGGGKELEWLRMVLMDSREWVEGGFGCVAGNSKAKKNQ